MKKVNKRIILILIILISIIAIILLFNKFNIIENIQTRIARNKALQQEDGISYILYDNQSEKLKIMVIITRQNGIERVEHLDSNENMTIYCDGRTTFAMDLNAEVNKEYRFNVISNGEAKIESITIPENYLESYFKFTSEEEYNVAIEYFNYYREDEEITNYYKIGKDSTNWKEYTENINLGIEHMEKIGIPATTVLTKQVDSIGDTLITEKTYDLPTTGDFDIFKHYLATGKSMTQYGFSKLSGVFNYFTANNISYTKSNGSGSWSNKCRLNFETSNTNLLIAKQLYIEFYFRATPATGKDSTAGAVVTLYYTDGTYESLTIPQGTYVNLYKDLTFDLDMNKQIWYMDISMSGYDGYGGSSHGRVLNIILKDVVV